MRSDVDQTLDLRPRDPKFSIRTAAGADTWVVFRFRGKMEYSVGEFGSRKFAIVPPALVNQWCVAGTVADAGNSQQIGCRLRQKHCAKEGTAPYVFQLSAPAATPDDMQCDFFPAFGLLNAGDCAELRQQLQRQGLRALLVSVKKSGRQSW